MPRSDLQKPCHSGVSWLPVEVEAVIPQKGHEIGFDGFAGHGVVDDQTQVGGVAPHGGDSP